MPKNKPYDLKEIARILERMPTIFAARLVVVKGGYEIERFGPHQPWKVHQNGGFVTMQPTLEKCLREISCLDPDLRFPQDITFGARLQRDAEARSLPSTKLPDLSVYELIIGCKKNQFITADVESELDRRLKAEYDRGVAASKRLFEHAEQPPMGLA